MDVFRVFDALNDVRNLREAIAAVRRTGKHAQGTICYTESARCTPSRASSRWPASCMDLGCDSHLHQGHGRAAQAAAGLRHRQGDQGDLRRGDPRSTSTCHATTGVTLVSLMKAIEAGADIVDTVDLVAQPRPRPQPDRGAGRDARRHAATRTELDKERLLKIKDHFAKVRPRYTAVRVEDHRRRDRDLRQPDPRRHDLQHGEPAQAAGRRRPAQGGARRGAAGPRRSPATRRW